MPVGTYLDQSAAYVYCRTVEAVGKPLCVASLLQEPIAIQGDLINEGSATVPCTGARSAPAATTVFYTKHEPM